MDLIWFQYVLLADLDRGLLAELRGRVHDLPDGEPDRVALVGLVLGRFPHEGLQLVVDAARFAGVPGGRLERHRRRAVRRHLEVKGVRIGAELADQPLLEARQGSVRFQRGEDLLGRGREIY